MVKSTSNKSYVKSSAAKHLGKPSPMDKTPGLDSEIRLYELEYSDKTEEGEEAEIPVVHDSIIVVSKENLIKRKFPYIYMFDHDGPKVVSAMSDITSRLFENLEITSPMDVDQRVSYMQHILIGAAPNKYKAFLFECKHSAKNLTGDKWTLSKLKGLSTEDFWTWDKSDRLDCYGDAYLVM